MGVPVRKEREQAADRFVTAGSPVGPSLNPDMLIEVSVRKLPGQHEKGGGHRIGVGRRRKNLGDIADLGRNGDPDMAGLAFAPARDLRSIPGRQGPDQCAGRAGQFLQSLRVGGHVQDHSAADENRPAQKFELFQQLLPGMVESLRNAVHEPKLGSAVPLLRPPGRRRQGRRGRHLGKEMSRRYDRCAEIVLSFQDQFPHPRRFGQISLGQHIPDNADCVIGIPMEGLDRKDHLLPVFAAVGRGAGGQMDAQAAGPQRDPLGHGFVGKSRRSHLEGELAQQRQVGLQLIRDVGDVERQIEVDDAVREQFVEEDGDSLHGRSLRRDRLDLRRDLADIELRQGCGRLRRVRLRLELLQPDGVFPDLFSFGFTQRGGKRGQPFPDLFLPLLQEGSARLHDREETVRVVDEPFADGLPEKTGIGFPFCANPANGAREIHVRQRVPVVEPGMEGPPHQNDSVRTTAADHLPSVKLHLVEGAFDELPVKTSGRRVPQGFQDQVFDPRGFVRVGSAQTDRKDDLPEVALQARDGREVLPEARIDEGLPERGCGAPDEQVGHNPDQHRRFDRSVFRGHPGQIHRALSLHFFILLDRKITVNGAGHRPAGLQNDGGVDLNPLEAREDLLKKLQMLLRRNVSVEQDAGV